MYMNTIKLQMTKPIFSKKNGKDRARTQNVVQYTLLLSIITLEGERKEAFKRTKDITSCLQLCVHSTKLGAGCDELL